MAHVADYKKKVVQDFARLMKDYPIIGIINMENLPTPQLQKMMKKLRGLLILKMTKRRLLKIAIEKAKESKPDITKIESYLEGMPALVFTKENPFKLYKMFSQSKSMAPAKPGQKAPKDILVQAGPTPFAPGPIIGELGAVGLKAGVEGGKVTIKQDAIIVKEGQIINDKVASMLLRLGIEPMEVGLNLVAVYENGTIYEKNILAVDEKEYYANITKAATWAFNLAIEANYYTKDTVTFLIQKASRESKSIITEIKIEVDTKPEKIQPEEKSTEEKVNEIVDKTKMYEKGELKTQHILNHANNNNKKNIDAHKQAEELLYKLQREGSLRK